MRTIWLVEDDFDSRKSIRNAINDKSIEAKVIELTTEHEFREQLNRVTDESNLPNLVILDIMLPWTKPMKNMPPEPDDVKEKGVYRAGARCEKLFREKQSLKGVPVIIYSNLQEDYLKHDVIWKSEKTYYLGKNVDITELQLKIISLFK
ncbi:MAG: response regulator [Methylococcaceae bacterium]|nr:response regulator [Methylococcaceae bacterium]